MIRSKKFIYWFFPLCVLVFLLVIFCLDNLSAYIDWLKIIVIITPGLFIFFSFLRNAVKTKRRVIVKVFSGAILGTAASFIIDYKFIEDAVKVIEDKEHLIFMITLGLILLISIVFAITAYNRKK